MGYVLVLIVLGLLIFGVWSIFNDIYVYVYDQIRYSLKITQPLKSSRKQILYKYSAYYKVLPLPEKKGFERRVQRFIYSKKFISRSSLPVSEEMKVLISASAIQLTFGLPGIYLSNFDKILIYPDSYYSHITKKYHLGEVNPRAGIILLSWNHFVEGYGDLTDSFNVGIHEMAHAIHFENRIRNEEFDFLNKDALQTLSIITAREMPKINSGKPHLLRAYAGTNEYEFFAVALEYFFEQPLQMSQQLPDLYQTIAMLLRQDPLKLYNFSSPK